MGAPQQFHRFRHPRLLVGDETGQMEHVKTPRRRPPGLTVERLGLGEPTGFVMADRSLEERLKFRGLHFFLRRLRRKIANT